MLLRFSMQNSNTSEAWERTYSMLKAHPECCDEVWLSTGTTVPLMQVHRDHVAVLRRAKEDLARLGIGMSLQVQMTIGHGDSMGSPTGWEGKTWSGWTGSTGVEDSYCNCPRQASFLSYMRQMARTYAEVHPRVVWIDDDLRYDNHAPATRGSRIGCWCATCLSAFSRQEGREWHREELDKAMGEDRQLALRWKMFSIESLCRIAAVIAEEMKAVSPQTYMGYQKTFWDSDTTVVRSVLQTLRDVSGKSVSYRAGGAAYYDRKHPVEQIVKSMDAARFMRVMGKPDYVASWCPEVESWPRHYGSRTAQAVLLEGFTALAYGMDAVSMYVTDRWEETPDLQARSMLAPVADGAAVLRAYARANEGTQAVGFGTEEDNHRLYEFGVLGIPVLPGLGTCLGMLSGAELKAVDPFGEPSSAVQELRSKMQLRALAPVVCQSPYVGLLIPRVSVSDGTLRTIGLLNGRIDEQQDVRIGLPSLPADVRKVVWHELRHKPLRLRVQRTEQGEAYVVVPSIAAWNAGFIEVQ